MPRHLNAFPAVPKVGLVHSAISVKPWLVASMEPVMEPLTVVSVIQAGQVPCVTSLFVEMVVTLTMDFAQG